MYKDRAIKIGPKKIYGNALVWFRIPRGTQNKALDILHRLKRIQLQSDVANVCSNDSRYLMKFPRNQPKRDNVRNVQSLPDRNEINVVVLRAKDGSIKDATNLGMETTDDLRSKLPPVSISSEENCCEEILDEQR
ncbi:hypothetical protein FQA39_LY07862 [Lamprigera yunnana]|nr:hypothetical protein FQA39_LY07862 [Lamprigera yunnana]